MTATDRMLLRRGLVLEYATLAWNVVGTAILILAAIAAGSVALSGFGVDSLIEIVASTVASGSSTAAPGPAVSAARCGSSRARSCCWPSTSPGRPW